MSKWSDDFEETNKDIKTIRDATKSLIKQGSEVAFEQYQDAKSIEKLKKLEGI